MEQGWRKKTVCIIDDDEDVRTIYHAKFIAEGFSVVTAKDGEEGLQLIRQQRPDIITLDVQMPILDGIGVLKMLKNDPELAGIPVIVLSNVEDDLIFQQIEALGSARYYLIKALTDTQKVVDMALEALAGEP